MAVDDAGQPLLDGVVQPDLPFRLQLDPGTPSSTAASMACWVDRWWSLTGARAEAGYATAGAVNDDPAMAAAATVPAKPTLIVRVVMCRPFR